MKGTIETMWFGPRQYAWFIKLGAYTLTTSRSDGYSTEDKALQAAKRAAKKFEIEIIKEVQ